MSQSIRKQILCALFAAAMAICAQLSIPVGLVPISMGSLAVLLAGGVLGKKFGTLSMVLYILLGAIGLPVFAMGKGGFSVLAGPTGGYIIGYVFMAFITGWFVEKYPQRKGMLLVGMVTGNLICYIFGTVWFMLVTQTAFWEALMLCVVPFLPGDAVKIVAAMLLSVKINKIITR